MIHLLFKPEFGLLLQAPRPAPLPSMLPTPGFLSLSILDILDRLILCCGGRPEPYGTFSSVPSLDLRGASSTLPPLPPQHDGQKQLQTMSSIPWGEKSPPVASWMCLKWKKHSWASSALGEERPVARDTPLGLQRAPGAGSGCEVEPLRLGCGPCLGPEWTGPFGVGSHSGCVVWAIEKHLGGIRCSGQ